jgi:hypothetical protein
MNQSVHRAFGDRACLVDATEQAQSGRSSLYTATDRTLSKFQSLAGLNAPAILGVHCRPLTSPSPHRRPFTIQLVRCEGSEKNLLGIRASCIRCSSSIGVASLERKEDSERIHEYGPLFEVIIWVQLFQRRSRVVGRRIATLSSRAITALMSLRLSPRRSGGSYTRGALSYGRDCFALDC